MFFNCTCVTWESNPQPFYQVFCLQMTIIAVLSSHIWSSRGSETHLYTTQILRVELPQCHAGLKCRTICPASDTTHLYRFAVKRTISTHNLANISRPVVFPAAVPDSSMRACLCAHECVTVCVPDLICQNNSSSRVIASQTCGEINLFVSFESVAQVWGLHFTATPVSFESKGQTEIKHRHLNYKS